MPKKSKDGSSSRKKRTPGIKQKLLKELRSKRKSVKSELRQIERDIRSLSGRRKSINQ